jgi:hypothetical protein
MSQRYADTTPESLRPALDAIRRQLALRISARSYQVLWEPSLAVKALDRGRKHVTLELPVKPQVVRHILEICYQAPLDKSVKEAGLSSWELKGVA